MYNILYDKDYVKRIKTSIKKANESWRKELLNDIKAKAHDSILECGCGLEPLFPDSFKIDKARLRLKDSFQWDCNNGLPYSSEVFDTIISVDMIEHLYDMDTFLHGCYRVLKTHGILIIATSNLFDWRKRLSLLFGLTNVFMYQYDDVGHVAFPCYRTMRKKFESIGLKDIEVKGYGNVRLLQLCGEIIITGVKA